MKSQNKCDETAGPHHPFRSAADWGGALPLACVVRHPLPEKLRFVCVLLPPLPPLYLGSKQREGSPPCCGFQQRRSTHFSVALSRRPIRRGRADETRESKKLLGNLALPSPVCPLSGTRVRASFPPPPLLPEKDTKQRHMRPRTPTGWTRTQFERRDTNMRESDPRSCLCFGRPPRIGDRRTQAGVGGGAEHRHERHR